MFTVTLDQPRNALTIAYRGRVTADETRRCAEEVRLAVTILEPEFRVIADLTALEATDLSCSSSIANIMEICSAASVAEVIRVIPDPTRDIGLQILRLALRQRCLHPHLQFVYRGGGNACRGSTPSLKRRQFLPSIRGRLGRSLNRNKTRDQNSHVKDASNSFHRCQHFRHIRNGSYIAVPDCAERNETIVETIEALH